MMSHPWSRGEVDRTFWLPSIQICPCWTPDLLVGRGEDDPHLPAQAILQDLSHVRVSIHRL